MKFSVLVAIVPEEQEQDAIDAAREQGAGGITVLSGRGISNDLKKTFFGLAFDGSQRVLIMVLEKSLSLQVMKAIQAVLLGDDNHSQGIVFTSPIEHLGGIDMSQIDKFEQHVKDSLKGNDL